MNRASQGLILGPVLLNILISHLDNTMESIFTKFAHDTKWGEEVVRVDRGATIQRDLDRLHDWANKNCMRLSKDKVLHPE